MGRPVQRLLAASGDRGLELKATDVGFQAGENLGHLNDNCAFLGVGRVREVLAYELAPHQRHRTHQMGRLIRPRTQRAGERPGRHGDKKDPERYQPHPH